jgi:hypothetical protein
VRHTILKAITRIFVTVLLLLSIESFSQFDNLGINSAWNKGSIDLATGKKLTGFIQNNEKLHLIRFKPSLSNDENTKLINEQDIALMEYYDSQTETTRKFASISYKAQTLPESFTGKKKALDLKNGDIEGVSLFEILMEYKQFAALGRITKVDVAKRTTRANALSAMDTKNDWVVTKKVGLEYYEEFYFFNDEGRLTPVLILNYLERDKENFLLKNNKPENLKPNLNRSALKRHMEQYWNQVEEYLDQNDLSMKVKNDFLSLLEYYKDLESQ